MPGGVPPDRGACRGVNGEAQCRPACDVERKMGADVDTAQSHQGDGGQGEGAAARAETGQGSHAKDDGHARVPGQVSEAAGVAAATADARKQGHRPGPPHYPLDRFGQRPGASAADQEAGCQLPVSGQPGRRGRRRDGTERAQLHDGPGGQVDRIGQAVDYAECPDFPWAHAVVAHGTGGGQQGSQAEAKLDAGSGQHGGKGKFMLARGPHHGLSVGHAGQPDGPAEAVSVPIPPVPTARMTHREPAGEGAGGDVSGVDVRGTISPLSAGAGGAGAGHAEYQVQRAPDEQAQARPRGDIHGEVRPEVHP